MRSDEKHQGGRVRRDGKGRGFGLEAVRSHSGLWKRGEALKSSRQHSRIFRSVGSEAPVPGLKSFSAIRDKL